MLPGVRMIASLLLSASILIPAAARAQSAEVAVQVGAVLTQADAEGMVTSLRAKGLDAYWVRAQVPGKGTRYRVRLGKFTNQSDAQQLAAHACAQRAITQFVIADGDTLPARPSFCNTSVTAARAKSVAPQKTTATTRESVAAKQAAKPKHEAVAPKRETTAAQAAPPVAPRLPSQRIARNDEPQSQTVVRAASQTAPVVPHTTPAQAPPATPNTAPRPMPVERPMLAGKTETPSATPRPQVILNHAPAANSAATPKAVPGAPEACKLQPGMIGGGKDCGPAAQAAPAMKTVPATSAAPVINKAPVAEALTTPKVVNRNWSVVQGGATDKDLRTVFFVDRLTGWAAGDGGMIYRTDDGGKNWAELPGAVVPNGIVDVNRIEFVDTRTGWMLGEMRSRDTNETQTVLLSTTDGGQIWQQQVLPGVLSFHFVNNKIGFAAGRSSGLYKTTDGGQRWRKLDSLERLVGQPVEASAYNFGFSDVHFIDATHGWAVGNFYGRALTHIGGLFVTSDGGDTWQRVPLVIQSRNNAGRFTRGMLHAVKFTDINHGTVTGEMEDGDETFFFTLKTRDGGQMWEQARIPSRSIHSTQFVDQSRGWTVAVAPREGLADAKVYDTVLLRTENGGRTWEPDYLTRGSRIRSVFFVSPTQGWAVGDRGLILRYEMKQEKASN